MMMLSKLNISLTKKNYLNIYYKLLVIRLFEEQSIKAYRFSKVGGFCHTYIGQESVAVGTFSILKKNDHIITGYRNHAHAILSGLNAELLLAELYGKIIGCSKGKGGSMHFFNKNNNYWGGHGIVGSQVGLATGISFSLKWSGTSGICICYLGEGAVNQGIFYECLNIVSLWRLPILFIIENNKYSMGTLQINSCVNKILSKRAKEFKMQWGFLKEGFDLFKVRDVTFKFIYNIRLGLPAGVLEVHTYRYKGHSMSDPDKTYRSKIEVNLYKNNYDPISFYKNYLLNKNIFSSTTLENCLLNIKNIILNSSTTADLSSYPNVRSIFDDIYWELDHIHLKKSKGTLIF